jgi:hypothetical protein
MKRIIYLAVVTFIGLTSFADPTVTDVVVKQRRPWGLVDITCKVSGIDETSKACVFMASAIIPDSGRTNRLSRFWIMKDGEKSMDWSVSANGSYRLLWDAKTDFGEVCYTNMVLSVTGRAAMVLPVMTGSIISVLLFGLSAAAAGKSIREKAANCKETVG